jgi:hypothetical protein
MVVFKQRTRTISVRLSDDEYIALQRLCVMTGARSVSDLTRDALLSLIAGRLRDGDFGRTLETIYVMVKSLDRKMDDLAATHGDGTEPMRKL